MSYVTYSSSLHLPAALLGNIFKNETEDKSLSYFSVFRENEEEERTNEK